MTTRVKIPASNITEVEIGDHSLFFSYQTLVVVRISGRGWFKTDCRWSATTSKHINKILSGLGNTVHEVSQSHLESLVKVEVTP